MAFPTKDTFVFDFEAQPDYPDWTPTETKVNMNARGEELRVALNEIINKLNSGELDSRYYTEAEIDANYETIEELTSNRKISPTGDFTGTLNGATITATDPGLSSTVEAMKGIGATEEKTNLSVFNAHMAENAYSSAHGIVGNANYLHTDNLLYTDSSHTVLATDDTVAIQSMINDYGSIFIGRGKSCRITNSLTSSKPIKLNCHGTLWLETPNIPLMIIDNDTAIENSDIFISEIKGIGKTQGQAGVQIKNGKFNKFEINVASGFKYIVHFKQRDIASPIGENKFRFTKWTDAEKAIYFENPYSEVVTALATDITTTNQLTLQLNPDTVLEYPCYLLIGDLNNMDILESVKVTGKTGSDYNIIRAQQSTTAKTFTVGTSVVIGGAWAEGNQFNGGFIAKCDKGVLFEKGCWAGGTQFIGAIDNADIANSTDWENLMGINRAGNLLLTRFMRWDKCVFGQDTRLEPNRIRGLVTPGNIKAGGENGNSTQVNNDGGFEVTKATGSPYIDFKTDENSDRDARIYKTANHALNFQTGGSAAIKEGFAIGANGTRYTKNAGYNVVVPISSAYIVVTLPYAMADANYSVQVTPQWNTTCWVPFANKGTTTFRIYFGTPPTAENKLDWQMLKIM